MDTVYIPYKLSQKVADWKPKWFYVENHGNSLPSILDVPPINRAEWLKKPLDTSQIPEVLEMIANLKQKGISGEAVVFDWVKRRIQPLQAPVTFSFEYRGKKGSIAMPGKRDLQRRSSTLSATTVRGGGTRASPSQHVFTIESSKGGK